MLAMSNPNVNPGASETQQMQIKAPAGVRSFPLALSLSFPGNLTGDASNVHSPRSDSGYVSPT